MTEYKPIKRRPVPDNTDRIRPSVDPSTGSFRSKIAGSNTRSIHPSKQYNTEAHASDSEWTSPADYIERCVSPSTEFSTLAGSRGLEQKSCTSNDSHSASAPHAHRKMESADTLVSKKTFLPCVTKLAASRRSTSDFAEWKMWNPFWLTNTVLVGFLLLFVALFFVVLAIYLYSEAHNGLLNGSENSHYVWTYLPTAIFVLATSPWHQVDFYCKELTSYKKMKQSPTPARQSILLDYVTPILPGSLWEASKNLHLAVVASIVGSLLLNLCTVLSSGLLFLSTVQVSTPTDSLAMLSNFNAANLDLADVTAGPVDTVYGVMARGLPWTYGTTQNLTVQIFDYNGTDDLSDNILTAQVPGFGVSMDCAPAQVGNLSNTLGNRPWLPEGILAQYLLGDISGPDCHLRNVSLGQTPGHTYFQENFDSSTGWKSNYQGFFDYYICNTGYDYVGYREPSGPQPNATSPEQYRFLLTVSKVAFFYNDTLNGASGDYPSIADTRNWTIAQSTAVLCKPSYSIDLYEVSLAPLNRTLLKANKLSNTSIDLTGFKMENFLDGVVNSLSVADFGEGGADYVIVTVPPMFLLLEALLTDVHNGSLLEPLTQPALLQNLSTQALQGIGTQFSDQFLKQAASEPLAGSYAMTYQRLQVKRLTVGLLLTTLGLLAITVLILIKFRPWDTAPCAIESLASAAIILASSKALRDYMRMGGPGLDNSVRHLEKCDYQTVVSPEGFFEIQPVVASNFSTASLHSKQKEPKKKMRPWWRPIATRKWFLVCVLLVPLILIAVLEAIQQVSDRKRGIATLESSDSHHLTISYIPVAVMLLLAMLYNSLNATVSAFTPFLALRRGNARAERSISTSLLSKLPPHAFYLSLRNHHWANSFTILAALVSSFLTIVTSGLYSPVTIRSSHAVQMTQLSAMNLSHVDLSEGDNLAGETTKLMMLFNLSNPIGTYDDLVFPSFRTQIPDEFLGGTAPNEEILISMTMPALRPSLQCTVAPVEDISSTDNVYHSGAMQLLHDGILTYGDPGAGVFSTQNTVFPWSLATSNTTFAKEQGGSAWWSHSYIIPNTTETSVPKSQIGAASPVQWIANGNASYIQQTSTDRTGTLDVDPSTANFGFAGGWAWGTRTNQVVNISLDGANTFLANTWDMKADLVIALCYQVLEEVQTNVTVNWPSMTTNHDNPPVPDQATARVIMSNETSTPTWIMNTTVTSASPHWFGISLNMFLWAMEDNNPTANWLDAWFTMLEKRKGGQPLSELLGQAHQEALIKASNDMYARYAVQAINANMRVSGATLEQDLPTYNATLLVPVLRLKQNKGPKIVLQVLLGIMAMCGAVAYSLLDTKEVLQQSPCSIVGKMELLARSELCNTRKVISEGSEWWDGRRRRQNGLFDGWFFSLGWWGDEMKWYGIDIGSAEKVE